MMISSDCTSEYIFTRDISYSFVFCRLFSNEGIDGFNALKNELAQWVKHQGSAIVVNPEKDSTMVNELLEFKQKIDEIMKKCFENNRVLGDAVHDAFKYFINIRKNRPAELIAKHVDQMMRSGNKGSVANSWNFQEIRFF